VVFLSLIEHKVTAGLVFGKHYSELKGELFAAIYVAVIGENRF